MKIGMAIPMDIVIRPTHNMGFIVEVGCARAVFENKDALLKAVDEYITDPKKLEEEYAGCCGNQPEAEVAGDTCEQTEPDSNPPMQAKVDE